VHVIQARSDAEVDEARQLFNEYAASLGFSLCFQSFDEEVASLPGKYAPPDGRLFLAVSNGKTAGCAALRRLDERACEMKRLYVRPGFRGRGLGRRLATIVIESGREIGYKKM
jgi:putative acetyltransferase